MFNKKTAIASLVLLGTSVFAHPIYYGYGLGIGQNNSSFRVDVDREYIEFLTGGNSLQVVGFVGYQAHISELYKLSIQADLGAEKFNKSIYSSSFGEKMDIKTDIHYGFSARAGVIRGDYTPYLIAGLRIGQWSLSLKDTDNEYMGLASLESSHVLGKKNLVAPELGVGVRFTLSDKVDVGLEYKYFFGGNITLVVDSLSDATYTLKARQQSVQFSLVF